MHLSTTQIKLRVFQAFNLNLPNFRKMCGFFMKYLDDLFQGSCQVMKELKEVRATSARSKQKPDEKQFKTISTIKLPKLHSGEFSKWTIITFKPALT